MANAEGEPVVAIVVTVLVFGALIVGVLNMGHETPTSACVPSKELLADQATAGTCIPASEEDAGQ